MEDISHMIDRVRSLETTVKNAEKTLFEASRALTVARRDLAVRLGVERCGPTKSEAQRQIAPRGKALEIIRSVLKDGPRRYRDIHAAIAEAGLSYGSASGATSYYVRRGMVVRVGPGVYALPGQSSTDQTPRQPGA